MQFSLRGQLDHGMWWKSQAQRVSHFWWLKTGSGSYPVGHVRHDHGVDVLNSSTSLVRTFLFPFKASLEFWTKAYLSSYVFSQPSWQLVTYFSYYTISYIIINHQHYIFKGALPRRFAASCTASLTLFNDCFQATSPRPSGVP